MIRLYQHGDAAGINELHEKVFGKQRSLAEWQWKFETFPESASIVVSEEDGRINGHAAFLKICARHNGKDITIGERVDIMVDPDAQGRGIYKQIVARMIQECVAEKIDILYGFPAQTAKQVFLKAAGGSDLGNVPRFLAVNKPGALLASKLSPLKAIQSPINKLFSASIPKKTKHILRAMTGELELADELYARFEDQYPLHAKRDGSYLQRRFLSHPEKQYRVYALESNGQADGYCVLHDETKENGVTFTTIVDLLGANDEAVIADQLKAIRRFTQADALNCWAVPESPRYRGLKKAGFFHINSPMPFVIKDFTGTGNYDQLTDWHLSQSDVDSY
ncbi:GNAT family N-acetyltransferase [Planococcus sp. ISL-109]|uniref:GNAT family N-acetyltransferase n=1 Tax=Planococcus sp. ISL-109 TaxID=2819166 RepID=UPI001BE94B66|nr:GNAT family N-acetyltransferase [Planococcus sp. ISL-109]MBT2581291.1 GNAT family N-acetyltransferase [Planococcus sp. ISL-109]